MGTRATISVVHSDGTVSTSYLHYDGYVSHAGKILKEHYNTLEAAEDLVGHGDMSSIGVQIYPNGEHSFDSREKGTCVFYGRDRGELGTEPQKSPSAAIARRSNSEEYNYIFEDGKWFVALHNKRYTEL